jgi:hypothetical protein
MSSRSPFGETISSVAPSWATAVERIVWLMVSPVVSAAATIAVPSMSPMTMSALRPRRRPTFRTPSFTRIGLRSARMPITTAATARTTRSPARSSSTGMPKSSRIAYRTGTDGGSRYTTS